ncbi:MAG: hypothetical protein HC929_12350 [Leptolyngbyaceae cyanobacterium SM2_5_2]|nr:hypothetical protein [Leptolyngbyaceae cyanobacterium SM2_5_2]
MEQEECQNSVQQDYSSEVLPESNAANSLVSSSNDQSLPTTTVSENVSIQSRDYSNQPAHLSNQQNGFLNILYSRLLNPNPQGLKSQSLIIAISVLLILPLSWFGIKELSQYLRYRHAKDNLEAIRSARDSEQYILCIQQANNFSSEFPDLQIDSTNIKSDCQISQAKLAKSSNDWAECIELSMAVDVRAASYQEAENLVGNCQLAQAQEFANERSFRKAIESIHAMSPEHPSFKEGQVLLGRWSREIIEVAKKEYQKEDRNALGTAINIASAIPQDTPLYSEAQSLIGQWKTGWGSDEANFKAAKAAFEKNDWSTAVAKSEQIKTNFWKKEVATIRQKAEANLAAAQRSRSSTQSSSTTSGVNTPTGSSSRSRRRTTYSPAPSRIQPRSAPPSSEPRELPRDRN